MKKVVFALILITLFSCERKIEYSSLRNEGGTYYLGNELYSGDAVFSTETEYPSTTYRFQFGKKLYETEYFMIDPASRKVKYEKEFYNGLLSKEKEYSINGLLLRQETYSWDMSNKTAEAVIMTFDWCGKIKTKKIFVCDEYHNLMRVKYEQNIPSPCN
ncbi:hypothetical protein [Flavobacterium sp. UBA4197]|uniref:hypothetical protein n=1 Tax=Flavobacterium sp. UBA4197 TaxID=1946546 RepID=UPI00257FADD6|nr:hypothetical protein [Flavobacterium sp. UBA4197]